MSYSDKAPQISPRKVLAVLRRLLVSCDDLAHSFTQKVDQMSLEIDDVTQTLKELAQQNPAIDAELQPGAGKRRTNKDQPGSAATYAVSVSISWGSRGADVTIDGRVVHLSATLGTLLMVLLSEDGNGSGHGWKSRSAVALGLGKQAGHSVSKHALENLISRLKKELQAQAGLGALVQCERRLGVRVALNKYALESPRPPTPERLRGEEE